MQLIESHLAYRIHKEQEGAAKNKDKISVQDAVRIYGLTKKESVVLELMIKGCCNKEICKQMVISGNTVKKHILSIYRKLDVKNRVQLLCMIKEV